MILKLCLVFFYFFFKTIRLKPAKTKFLVVVLAIVVVVVVAEDLIIESLNRKAEDGVLSKNFEYILRWFCFN